MINTATAIVLLSFQGHDFEEQQLNMVFKTSRSHLLLQDSSRLSIDISGIFTGSTAAVHSGGNRRSGGAPRGANLNFMRSLRVMKITRIFRMIRVIKAPQLQDTWLIYINVSCVLNKTL